jgi:hypothetical protein
MPKRRGEAGVMTLFGNCERYEFTVIPLLRLSVKGDTDGPGSDSGTSAGGSLFASDLSGSISH